MLTFFLGKNWDTREYIFPCRNEISCWLDCDALIYPILDNLQPIFSIPSLTIFFLGGGGGGGVEMKDEEKSAEFWHNTEDYIACLLTDPCWLFIPRVKWKWNKKKNTDLPQENGTFLSIHPCRLKIYHLTPWCQLLFSTINLLIVMQHLIHINNGLPRQLPCGKPHQQEGVWSALSHQTREVFS